MRWSRILEYLIPLARSDFKTFGGYFNISTEGLYISTSLTTTASNLCAKGPNQRKLASRVPSRLYFENNVSTAIMNIVPRALHYAALNPGLVGAAAGTAVTENNNKKHNTSKLGKIIGAAVGGALLLILIVFAVWYDRRKKRKARQGTKLRETGVDADEEARPMVQSGEGMGMGGGVGGGMGERVGMPRPLMLQAGAAYFPPQGEGMYGGSGYGQVPGKDVLYEHPNDAGHRGTDFYRNQ